MSQDFNSETTEVENFSFSLQIKRSNKNFKL